MLRLSHILSEGVASATSGSVPASCATAPWIAAVALVATLFAGFAWIRRRPRRVQGDPGRVGLIVGARRAGAPNLTRPAADPHDDAHAAASKEDEELLRRAIYYGHYPKILHTDDGAVLLANRAMKRMAGLSRRGALTVRDIERSLGLDRHDSGGVIVSLMGASGPRTASARPVTTRDGSVMIWDIACSPLGRRSDGRTLYLTTAVDVTARVQDARRLDELRARAQATSDAKGEFLANMSHELRTPLNAIIGFSDLLLDPRSRTSDDQRRHYAERIGEAGRHLLALVEAVLDTAKADAGTIVLNIAPLSLRDLLRGCLETVGPMASTKRIALSCRFGHSHDTVPADALRVRQILLNLLTNAIKFTPEAGSVVASTSSTRGSGEGTYSISVADTGKGVPPKHHQAIFERFGQLDSSPTRRHQGAGLGLALSRHLAELHGGTLSVGSDGVPGRGAVFTLTLPSHTPPQRS